jgi:hypothetical protein
MDLNLDTCTYNKGTGVQQDGTPSSAEATFGGASLLKTLVP